MMSPEKMKMMAVNYGGWGFLFLCLVALAAAYQANNEIGAICVEKFLNIFWEIVPILFVVFILLFFFNAFLDQEKIARFLGRQSGLRGWGLAVFSGILAYGPSYMWYPMLADLKQKGMRTSLAVTFLYNRGIQLALLPMMIFYFGAWLSFLLIFAIMLFSVVNGWLVEKLVNLGRH